MSFPFENCLRIQSCGILECRSVFTDFSLKTLYSHVAKGTGIFSKIQSTLEILTEPLFKMVSWWNNKICTRLASNCILVFNNMSRSDSTLPSISQLSPSKRAASRSLHSFKFQLSIVLKSKRKRNILWYSFICFYLSSNHKMMRTTVLKGASLEILGSFKGFSA